MLPWSSTVVGVIQGVVARGVMAVLRGRMVVVVGVAREGEGGQLTVHLHLKLHNESPPHRSEVEQRKITDQPSLVRAEHLEMNRVGTDMRELVHLHKLANGLQDHPNKRPLLGLIQNDVNMDPNHGDGGGHLGVDNGWLDGHLELVDRHRD